MSQIERSIPCPSGAACSEPEAPSLAPAKMPPSLVPCLPDPNFVHLNMLTGRIARPSVKQIRHIYGAALDAAHTEEHDHATDRRA